MWAEKPWAEVMANKLGKETWKELVAKLDEERKGET